MRVAIRQFARKPSDGNLLPIAKFRGRTSATGHIRLKMKNLQRGWAPLEVQYTLQAHPAHLTCLSTKLNEHLETHHKMRTKAQIKLRGLMAVPSRRGGLGSRLKGLVCLRAHIILNNVFGKRQKERGGYQRAIKARSKTI